MKLTSKLKKFLVWFLSGIILILAIVLISFTSVHHIRGEELLASDVQQYYLLEEGNMEFQTFQFQPCRVMSYSVIGQIIGKKVNNEFIMDSITFKAHILNGSIFHINSGIRVTEADFKIDTLTKTLKFNYKLDFYDKNEIDADSVLHVLDTSEKGLIVDGYYTLEFVPRTESTALELYCEISKTFSGTGSLFFPGGGYECDGIGVIKP